MSVAGFLMDAEQTRSSTSIFRIQADKENRGRRTPLDLITLL
ncbi:hypothetical protein [Bacillus sp. 166amftsu]|nr:hypothetical protein [Bacillus sp. 166amftsu]